MGVADPATAHPPGHGMARPAGWQERETLPRDPTRGDDRRGPQAQARAPGNEGQGARQDRLRVPAVRRGVAAARLAQEREGAPPETRGGHLALPVPRRGSLATGQLFGRLRRRRRHPLNCLGLLHPLGGLSSLAARPLLLLEPSRVQEGAHECEAEDEQRAGLGGPIIPIEQAKDKEDQNPEDDVARNPSLREIEDAAHRPGRWLAEAKNPPVPFAAAGPFQRYIAMGGVCESDSPCPP